MNKQQQRRLIARLEAMYGPKAAKVFLETFKQLKRQTNIPDLIRALEAFDADAVAAALGIKEASLRGLERQVTEAFEAAGEQTIGLFPRGLRGPNGLQARLAFDIRHPQAEIWLRERSSGLITRIIEEQREVIRDHLATRLSEGVNPRESALRLAGRINPSTGRREGGVLGLTQPQNQWVRNAREQLNSTDPEDLRAYLTRTKRDRRFDRFVRKALENGTGIPVSTVDQMVDRYTDRLLLSRAETVSKTETLNALRAGKFEAERQGMEQAGIPRELAKKTWRRSGKAEPREDHVLYSGTSVQVDEPFILPSGTRLMFPGDSSLGAGAGDIANCGCVSETTIDFIEHQARIEGS